MSLTRSRHRTGSSTLPEPLYLRHRSKPLHDHLDGRDPVGAGDDRRPGLASFPGFTTRISTAKGLLVVWMEEGVWSIVACGRSGLPVYDGRTPGVPLWEHPCPYYS